MIHIFHTSAAQLARKREQLARRSLVAVGLPGLGVLLWAWSIPVVQFHHHSGCDFTGVAFEALETPPVSPRYLEVPFQTELAPPAPEKLPVFPEAPPISLPEELALEGADADDEADDSEIETELFPIATKQPGKQTASAPPPAADSGAFTPPAYLDCPQPPYPPHLRQRRISGTVGVCITVAADGTPTQVQISAPSGHPALDSLARRWILQHWRFSPACRSGHPIQASVSTSITFALS